MSVIALPTTVVAPQPPPSSSSSAAAAPAMPSPSPASSALTTTTTAASANPVAAAASSARSPLNNATATSVGDPASLPSAPATPLSHSSASSIIPPQPSPAHTLNRSSIGPVALTATAPTTPTPKKLHPQNLILSSSGGSSSAISTPSPALFQPATRQPFPIATAAAALIDSLSEDDSANTTSTNHSLLLAAVNPLLAMRSPISRPQHPVPSTPIDPSHSSSSTITSTIATTATTTPVPLQPLSAGPTPTPSLFGFTIGSKGLLEVTVEDDAEDIDPRDTGVDDDNDDDASPRGRTRATAAVASVAAAAARDIPIEDATDDTLTAAAIKEDPMDVDHAAAADAIGIDDDEDILRDDDCGLAPPRSQVDQDGGDTAMPDVDAMTTSAKSPEDKKPPQSLIHTISWSVSAEKGYRNVGMGNAIRQAIHEHLEDEHWPALEDREEWSGRVGPKVLEERGADLSMTTRIFVLADGHGGVEAARFFVPRTKEALEKLMASRSWDFSVADDRIDLTYNVSSIFRILDAEYCAQQVGAYRRWVDAGSKMERRPTDDGCTLVATILHNDHLVNLNVGDSRTVLMDRPHGSNSISSWRPTFSSVDHNMTHPDKVWGIHRAGGHFINPNGTLKYVTVESPAQRGSRPYLELEGARIYRHPTDAVRAVGVSHKRTLNLTATMGDLLFKIEPAILSPVPDVSFVKLEPARDYALVMATDGIWDHLMVQNPEEAQNGLVMGVVAAAISSWESEVHSSASSTSNSEKATVAAGRENSGGGSGQRSPTSAPGTVTAAIGHTSATLPSAVVDEAWHSAASSSLAAATNSCLASSETASESLSVSSDSTAVSPLQSSTLVDRLALAASTLVQRELVADPLLYANLIAQQEQQQTGASDAGVEASSSSASSSSSSSSAAADAASKLVPGGICPVPDIARSADGMYLQRMNRYDDATAYVIYLHGGVVGSDQ